ncbi:MAG: TonB-dependent receptor [Tannerellaceae bacterium]|jgi:outer membrane receptor for ferrienterochelin and colicin|nr:TonB-dependent receptor [Tannerellaceae bacterium]
MNLRIKAGSRILILFSLFSWNIKAQETNEQDSLRNIQTEEIVVSSVRSGTILSSFSSFKTEMITQTGLKKMACCNLSESFENSASATVGFTDAVSGAKQIQLLGLSGIYSQTLAENIPTLRGLASTYGLSYIPASWLETIQISKGTSSVINGYESITGQINLEFKKPNNTESLFINAYTDDDQHYEINITTATQVAPNLWTSLLLSGMTASEVHDENSDNFLDMPNVKYVNVYNRWFYLNDEKGIQSRTGIKFLYEDRVAGQTAECHKKHGVEIPPYGLFETSIHNKNFTAYNKTGIAIAGNEGQSLGLINSFTHHEQNSIFGRKNFSGTQNSYYLNFLLSSFINNTSHRYMAGASFVYDKYNTQFTDNADFNTNTLTHSPQRPLASINRTEIIPGIFVEYTNMQFKNLTLVAGLRTDYNSFFGWLVTPRLNIKYDVNNFVVIRASAGRGFRSPNILAENIGLMASSRRFNITDINDLDIEQAWNFGGNIAFNIPIWSGKQAKLSLDYFHTRFTNQTITDTERNRNEVFFYNSNGTSNYANAWQADLAATIFKGLDLFAAFRYNNNNIVYIDGTRLVSTDLPLVSNYRGLVNISYATPLRKWIFDATAQFNGKARLPGLNGYDSEKIYSPAFPVYFAQITRNTKRFDIYLGAENIFSFTQKEPIREWVDPFARDFDASMIWGPVSGARIYGGIRLRIGKLY